jgi:hypothetical protein
MGRTACTQPQCLYKGALNFVRMSNLVSRIDGRTLTKRFYLTLLTLFIFLHSLHLPTNAPNKILYIYIYIYIYIYSILIFMYVLFCIFRFHRQNWHSSAIYIYIYIYIVFLLLCMFCSVYFVFIVPTGTLRLPWLRFFYAFSSVVKQMPGYNSQRRGMARTLLNQVIIFTRLVRR